MVSQTLLRSVSSRLFRQRTSSLSLSSSTSSSSTRSSLAAAVGTTLSNNNNRNNNSIYRFKSTAAVEDDVNHHESETFLSGTSSLYAEQMYLNYQQNPDSVHETWRKYFDDLDNGREYDSHAFNRPTVVTSSRKPSSTDANESHLAVSLFCCN